MHYASHTLYYLCGQVLVTLEGIPDIEPPEDPDSLFS